VAEKFLFFIIELALHQNAGGKARYSSMLTTGHWLSMKQMAKCQANVTDLALCNDGTSKRD